MCFGINLPEEVANTVFNPSNFTSNHKQPSIVMLLLHVSAPVDYLQGDRLQSNTVVMLPKVPEDDQQGPKHIEVAAQRMVDVRLLYGGSVARK
jgi:hypothetical protein